ncbi:MAG: aldo/keto reductase [FCB group bacterium]|jgi:aryl-alcohol dehydrogenase-like predicted oxidoreductase|nr:aldo/keto reductase [FCB group bacterium]
MEFRQLGKSELKMPVVSFGAWAIGGWMWGGTDDENALRALQRGIDAGVTCIDTAPIYGTGHSESVVGKAIAGRRNEVTVATKCGLRWDLDEGEFFFESTTLDGRHVRIHKNLRPHSIRYECEQSLCRLGIDCIDLYQCHWPDSTTPLDETVDALLRLREEGKIREFGVSNFTTDMMSKCLEKAHLASNQPKYNALERDIEADVLPFCVQHEIGILAYSPIAQGLLTGKVGMNRDFPSGDIRLSRPWFAPENRRRVLQMLEKWKPIAEAHDATLAQIAINWLISQKGVTSALVGARNESQVLENARAGKFQLTPDELATVRRAVEELGAPVTNNH